MIALSYVKDGVALAISVLQSPSPIAYHHAEIFHNVYPSKLVTDGIHPLNDPRYRWVKTRLQNGHVTHLASQSRHMTGPSMQQHTNDTNAGWCRHTMHNVPFEVGRIYVSPLSWSLFERDSEVMGFLEYIEVLTVLFKEEHFSMKRNNGYEWLRFNG